MKRMQNDEGRARLVVAGGNPCRMPPRLHLRSVLALILLVVGVLTAAAPALAVREVRVGTWSYPPQVALDEEGRPEGIFIDIVEAVGARHDWRIAYVHGTWEDTLARLGDGTIDLGLGVGQVALRTAEFDLNNEPVVSDWGQIYTRDDGRLETILDLEGKTVVGWRDDRTYRSLQRLARTFGVSARYLATNSIDDNFAMVDDGRADAVVDLRIPGRIYQKKYGLVASPLMFSPITFGFATARGRNADLLRQLDAFIHEGKDDPWSEYNQIMDRWLGTAPTVRSQIPGYVAAIIAGVAGVAILFVAMSLLLKHQVNRRTEALRGERDMVKRLLETSPVGIAFAAADGRVTLSNARAEDLLGASCAPGRPGGDTPAWHTSDAEDDPFAALEAPVAEVLEARQPVHDVMLEVDCRDGRHLLLSVSGAPMFSERGQISGVLTAFDDVTERERAREELERHREHLEELVHQRTRELEAANEQLESFSYSVSHDLRAPLRALDGFSLALLEDSGEQLDDDARRHLDRIRRAPRAGHTVELTDVSLSAIVERVTAGLEEEDGERRVEWRLETGLSTRTDAFLAEVVLENLLGNAWKFSADRTPAHIEFGARDVDGERVYYVRDDGIGFDPAYADKLFQPFERLHATERFEGTGIGLATVRRAVIRLGGRCWAEGTPDEGATFFFTL